MLNSEFLIVQKEGLFLPNKALLGLLQEVLSKGNSLRLRVKGFSMFPCIRNNDIVTVSPLNGFLSYTGLAVAFIHPYTNKLVIHRVIRQNKYGVVTKGDCSFSIDGLVPHKNILGIVTKIERNNRGIHFGIMYGRSLALFLNKTNIFALFFHLGMHLPRFIRRVIKRTLFR